MEGALTGPKVYTSTNRRSYQPMYLTVFCGLLGDVVNNQSTIGHMIALLTVCYSILNIKYQFKVFTWG